MHIGISKSRLRRVGRLRREQRARLAEKIPFRNGTPLAALYLAVVLAATLGLALLLPANGFDLKARDVVHVFVTDCAILGLAAFCCRGLLGELSPAILRRNSRILLLGVTALLSNGLFAAVAEGLDHLWAILPEEVAIPVARVSPYLLPYFFGPAVATLLAGTGAGIAFGLALALQNVLFVPRSDALAVVLCGSAAAIAVPILLHGVHRKTRFVRLALSVGLAQLLAAVAATGPFLPRLARSVLELGAGAEDAYRSLVFLGGLFALVLLPSLVASVCATPVLEHVFAACTDIRLDAFADLSHPLLKRLEKEAPGTYYHALAVANLASAAAESIGANALLARVGAYYHDVGKLSEPGKFTENIFPGAPNPHDAIPPSLSAVVLSAHVKDGDGYARAYGLPVAVREIITEHHGNSLMGFFYAKAVRQAEEAAREHGGEPDAVDPGQFRYASPRPSTAEAAAVMLADSVEAASRSLTAPSPTAVEKLVDKIVCEKFADGQLDDAPLTCADIAEIRRTFCSILPTILHGRIPYPEPSAAPPPGRPAEPPANA